jgi:hypothetical protein
VRYERGKMGRERREEDGCKLTGKEDEENEASCVEKITHFHDGEDDEEVELASAGQRYFILDLETNDQGGQGCCWSCSSWLCLGRIVSYRNVFALQDVPITPFPGWHVTSIT